MPLAPGRLIKDNIELVRVLGEGGMGVVWVGRNRSLDTEVAVKVLHGHLANAALRERFVHEARSVARIDSPHVVKIFDFGTTDEGEPFFVMEMLRGTDLETRIEKHGALSPADTANVLRQLCRALGRAHELGVVHRDIKPANVFLVDSQGDLFVKVLDFGVAKQLGPGDLGLTATGAMMGTPYYMSPEQFVSPRNVDHRTDLWATAVLAYACLTGQLPFQGETVGALSLAVHKGEFRAPTELDHNLPAGLDAWFRRALAPQPEHRFQTALELTDAFQQAVAAGPAPALAETATASEPGAAGELPDRPATFEGAARSVAENPTRGRSLALVAGVLGALAVGALVVSFVARSAGRRADEAPAVSAPASVVAAPAAPPPSVEPPSTAPAPSAEPKVSASATASAPPPPVSPPPARVRTATTPAPKPKPEKKAPPSNCYVMVNGKLTIKPECL